MTDEEKKTFARRITEANPSELTVVLYDMLIRDLTEAKNLLAAGGRAESGQTSALHTGEKGAETAAVDCISHAERIVGELRDTLDFGPATKEASMQLYSLYDFILRSLSKAVFLLDAAPVADALRIVTSLRETFAKVAEADKRGPVLQNAESTYAGLTYGRVGLSEVSGNYDANRGFLA